MKKKTISVILISYNQEAYITQALDGIRMQSLTPDEVIIADDASSDATQSIISNYLKQYNLESKWKILFATQNRGINCNIQNAINNSNGEFILLMAGDDISLPNQCQLSRDLLLKYPEVNLVATSGYVINSSGEIIGERNERDRLMVDIKKSIKLGYPGVSPVGQAFRRCLFDFFGPLPTDVPNEDDQISFRGLALGGILVSSTKTHKYRVHDKSASSWLRDSQSSENSFFYALMRDMADRRKHFFHWIECIEMTSRSDRATLIRILIQKIELYQFLENIESLSFIYRIRLLKKYFFVTCSREICYLIFGKFGIHFWRNLRCLLK